MYGPIGDADGGTDPEHAIRRSDRRTVNDLLIATIPLALAAALNPTAIAVEAILLSAGKSKGAAFLGGFTLVFLAIGVVGVTIGIATPTGPNKVSDWIDIVAAVLLALLGFRSWRGSHKQKVAKAHKVPSTRESFAFGIALAVTDFSSVIPYLVALKNIGRSPEPNPVHWLMLVLFNLIALAPLYLPVIGVYAAPATADRVLTKLRDVLAKHGTQIGAVVCWVFAVYLLAKGVKGLAS